MSADDPACRPTRRALIAATAVGLATRPGHAAPSTAANALRPQPGDRLVFAEANRRGIPIAPQDLLLGGPQLLAWPMAADATIRDGSRGNQVLLLRLDPASLDAVTRSRAAAGIVAYSALCSHAGCVVKAWQASERVLQCPCHNSRYDPRQAAAVVFGPAPRRLAALPVAIAEGALVVAGPFIGSVGPPTGA